MGQRSGILDDFAARIDSKFGLNGSDGQWLRKVKVGQYNPEWGGRPWVCVAGGDQQHSSGERDPEDEKTMETDVDICLSLQDNWDRDETYDEWIDNVNDLVRCLWNWLPAYGVLRNDYIDDVRGDAVLRNGDSRQLWVIRFRVRYMFDVGIIGKD